MKKYTFDIHKEAAMKDNHWTESIDELVLDVDYNIDVPLTDDNYYCTVDSQWHSDGILADIDDHIADVSKTMTKQDLEQRERDIDEILDSMDDSILKLPQELRDDIMEAIRIVLEVEDGYDD